jgi:hypothetical protein
MKPTKTMKADTMTIIKRAGLRRRPMRRALVGPSAGRPRAVRSQRRAMRRGARRAQDGTVERRVETAQTCTTRNNAINVFTINTRKFRLEFFMRHAVGHEGDSEGDSFFD